MGKDSVLPVGDLLVGKDSVLPAGDLLVEKDSVLPAESDQEPKDWAPREGSPAAEGWGLRGPRGLVAFQVGRAEWDREWDREWAPALAPPPWTRPQRP